MRAKYQRNWSAERALLLAYRAKKSAEVDPFVGLETDMFVIGFGLKTSPLNDDLYFGIQTVYEDTVNAEKAAIVQGDEDIESYVEAFFGEQEEETVQQGAIQDGAEPKQLFYEADSGEADSQEAQDPET
jgi:hypothetical protein